MSTLTVQNLRGDPSTSRITVPTGHKFYAPGGIVQTVQTVKTDAWSTSSTTPADITGMTASITPTTVNSKILVLVDLKWSLYGHGDVYLLRDSGKIYYGDAYASQTQASLHGYGSGSYGTDYGLCYGGIRYLDSPGTTSTVTYKLQAAVPYSSSYAIAVNYLRPNENYNYNARLASTIVLMEIGQ